LATNYRQIYAKQKRQREQLLAVNPKLNDEPGIYFLLRNSEENFKFAYIGQTRQGILSRLVSHLNGYEQHIDLSLKRHKLWSEDNPYGWRIEFMNCPIDRLDDLEIKYIKAYADAGYQLRNSSLGGQGANRASGQIGERKQPKTYTQGKVEGKKQLAKQLSSIIDKHLEVKIQPGKENNKVSQKQRDKFFELIDERSYE
jgi:hypothetical protein